MKNKLNKPNKESEGQIKQITSELDLRTKMKEKYFLFLILFSARVRLVETDTIFAKSLS